MLDYDFYVNSYLGTAIPEKVFSGMAARAADALAQLRRQYRVVSQDEVSEKMALRALAETLYGFKNRKQGVTSATVGGVSVRYENSTLHKRLLEQARIYLDIYRGVSA